ncbi:MAG: NDP-sugar synthase [Nitrospira sp.]|nr:NDP-sugar synthase [Nitrospira sp.]MDH4369227.1 NDP-sugar synthase [Nitrospira sp.]MDH5346344.1 NDP-sugar synthase [Nitrospira sp.]MDH5496677.1 NDP-sugar synthase [Nitrospira sp.]MDH5726771.1 NDP-sugar synthase [Nitrospira sp.]
MILAAGLGTRLRPLTNTIPKPLLSVGGTPLIVWNVLLMKRHGFHEIVVNLHHLGPMIEQALGDGSKFGVRIMYSQEPVILGTGGGIKQAEHYFSGEPVLIMNGDTLVELDLGALWDFHHTRQAAATLVLREDSDAAQWGLVEVGANDQILRITGKGLPSPSPAIPRMFAGIHILHPRLLRQVPKGVPSSIIAPYVAAIEGGERVLGYDLQGYWSDIGTAERYTQAEKDTRAGLIRLADRQPLETHGPHD